MNRDKQIEQTGEEYCKNCVALKFPSSEESLKKTDILAAYRNGAEWADKHPRKDLIEFNKVYIWLTDFLDNHYIEEKSTGNEINSDYVLAEFMQWKNKV